MTANARWSDADIFSKRIVPHVRCYSRYPGDDSYISASASSDDAAAEMAASRKQAKYTPRCQGRTLFQRSSQLLWKLWVQSTNQLCNSKTIWTTKSSLSLPMTRRDNFSSNDSLSLCRYSTPSYCMSRLGVRTTGTFSRPAFLLA